MKNCPYCFAQNPDDSVFCLSCGQNMSVPPAPVAPEAPVYQQVEYAPQQQQQVFTPPQQPYAPPTYSAAPPAPVGVKPPKPGDPSKNWAGVLSMILGILSLVLCCIFYISPFFAIAGIIFSVIGKKSQQKGMSTAGMITSIIGLLLVIIFIVVVVILGSSLDWLPEELQNAIEFSYSTGT